MRRRCGLSCCETITAATVTTSTTRSSPSRVKPIPRERNERLRSALRWSIIGDDGDVENVGGTKRPRVEV